MNRFLLLILFISVFGPFLRKAKAFLPEQILNGDAWPEDKLKYQVSIQAAGVHLCGGGIIDNMLIATVAHCFINKDKAQFNSKQYKIVATGNILNKNATIAGAEVEIVYFLKTFELLSFSNKSIFEAEEEFVILKLKRGLGLDNSFWLKKLETTEKFFFSLRNSLIVSGYGAQERTMYGTFLLQSHDGNLKYAHVNIVSKVECSKLYNATIQSFHMCARVKQMPGMSRGTCKGDSGGPLVQNDKTFIGVIAFCPSSCSESILPGIYMRISHYRRFIENVMKGNTSEMRVFELIKYESKYRFIEVM